MHSRYSAHSPALPEDPSDTLYANFSSTLSLNWQNVQIYLAEDTEMVNDIIESLEIKLDLLYHKHTPGDLEGE